jgi:type I pantothenate kinase
LTSQSFAELAELVQRRLTGAPPHLVGISGAVAAGKTTVAEGLAEQLRIGGRKVDIVTTDAFLRSNAELDELGLSFRKGFPESFHLDALTGVLRGIKIGAAHVELPVYSHLTYDLVPGARTSIDHPDLVIVEGIVGLRPELAELLDVRVYIDASELDLRLWFATRFLEMTRAARVDEASFYREFVEFPDEELVSLAEATWDGINGVNLREHILPTRERADIVVEKARDHSIKTIRERIR